MCELEYQQTDKPKTEKESNSIIFNKMKNEYMVHENNP